MAGMLNDAQMAEFQAMLNEDAANPAPPEEQPAMEEGGSVDEVDTVNDTVQGMSEGEGETQDPEVIPDPNAGNETQTAAGMQLPDGFTDVNQLIEAYNLLKAGSGEMQALRELNGQLVSIAEALGYGKDVESVDLSAGENDPNSAVKAEVRKVLGPMIEQQQKNIRQRMIDQEWKRYAGEHEDLADMMEDIKAIVGEDPGLADSERGLEIAHQMARSRRYKPEKALMEDEEFIRRAAGNEKIRRLVIEDYLKKVARSGEEAPEAIGSGGSAASSGRKKPPATIQEAAEEFRRMLRE